MQHFPALFIIYPVGSPLFSQFSVMGAKAKAGTGFSDGWGSWLGYKNVRPLGVVATWVWGQQFQLHVPGHPNSICGKGIYSMLGPKASKSVTT